MRKRISIGLIFLLILFGIKESILAQNPPSNKEMQDLQKQSESMMQKTKKMQDEELEALKKINPEFYKTRKDALDKMDTINAIISSFYEKKISESQAKAQLYPLVKQDLAETINNLDKLIAALEKKLQFYRDAKRDPSLLVNKRIDEMLGKSMPDLSGPLQ